MPLRTEPQAPRIWAVIPAAGVGQRALRADQQTSSRPLPKQYHRLVGCSVLAHTLQAFAQVQAIAGTAVVIAPDDAVFSQQAENHVARTQAFAVGGDSRAASVRNGLQTLAEHWGAQDHDWVLVHDAARCLITPEWIARLISACQHDAVGGLLALPLPDTLKEQRCQPLAEGHPKPAAARVAQTVPRSGKWLAHTPQMFRLGMLRSALQQADLGLITDEASAIEWLGHAPLLVHSSAQNFKVTYPEDFALAEAILMARQARHTPNSTESTTP
ncbi:2-C-methyl-D-erythritol 4-phosphate cytidylyltransferase [Lampropedia aestuarii]|uniref:2-C-methyl-D-erythritol 4-phosphate cytidylyltransferase n=1 Tax=Lampropedia aestuarii TaxID=2562762 RepID=A0A4S5BIN5_9BURK|nr:2-C-methyl-D-erythritol 4-phosphate cytidylyltransferase [Lampropedia aestuarii]THJ32009.1 2-C-methyl-D-erythritol 4-phosphate cytidylyltransferase [Lampropedia aestuarii]